MSAQWNDSEPNPDFDLSGVKPMVMSDHEARRILGVADDEDIVEHVEEEYDMWDQEFATEDDAPIEYVHDGKTRRR